MTGFDELTCYCGSEVLYPPIPCGTNPPECHKPCTRQHGCDHTGMLLYLHLFITWVKQNT